MGSRRWTVLGTALCLALLLAPGVQACLSPYGFRDFEPTPLVAPGGDVEMAPVNVSASTVDDMNHKLISYKGDLYALWVKETGRTEVAENVMCRVRRDGKWSGQLLAVNNIVPENGSFEGEFVRVAGYDVVVHDGLLWVVWSTPDLNFTHGTDDDLVYRTFDGERWGPVTELMPPDDGWEDTQPTIASTEEGLLVAWTTNNREWCEGADLDVASMIVDQDGPGPITSLSPEGDGDMDFIPELVAIPDGAYLTWYTRRVLPSGPGGAMENVVVIQGRSLQEGAWSDVQAVSATDRGENIWVDMLWDGQRLGLVWQVSSSKLFYKSSDIIYREWEGGFLSTPLDLTSSLRGSFNGRPELGFAGDEVRVYWHTNDDGFTVGNSYDLVWRSREEGGHWGPLETFQVDRTRELYQIYLTEHEGGLYASWMANVTYVLPPPLGTMSVWDIWVAPAYLAPDPLAGMSVTHRWQRTVELWGPKDSLRFRLERDGEPVGGTSISVVVEDPGGDVEVVLSGTTGGDGWIGFDHSFESWGQYNLNMTVGELPLGSVELLVDAPPPGHGSDLAYSLAVIVTATFCALAAGYLFVRRRGVVRGRRVLAKVEPPRSTPWIWSTLSRALTWVVRNRLAQGILQIPLFVLFMLSMVIGFFGTQVPQSNFSSMVGWTYYLAGMMLLYAIFGRLWCYVEACGFVDTWAKVLLKRRRWLEWPSWLKNLWPGFIILLSGFWVEIVLSIDLFPWLVATYMLVTILINLVISVNFGKRTYCRFVCRDGVVEELIARYSIFRIGVRTRVDSVSRGDPCIWGDEERRPGYCSMCFSCVQDDPLTREATVEPAVSTFAEDVYKPQATHRDEAMASIVLMGISIPYILVLSRLWWEGLGDLSQGVEVPLTTAAILALVAAVIALTAVVDLWAFRRWPRAITPIRRALVIIVEGMLIVQLLLFSLGGPEGRTIALRSSLVLACFVLPFIAVYLGEAVVVRLTGNSRGESPWRLLERYGLVFIPVFLGVLVARNLPIVGMWGWAAWDIVVATFTDFPGGVATVMPRPFVDPALFFGLGVLALVIGLLVGAYAALQLSRRLFREERHAMIAFGVHTGLLCAFVAGFVALLALPPF